jgi:tRNA (guanine-N7-)-methyltransferase
MDNGHQLVLNQRTREVQARFGQIFDTRTQFVWEIGCGHGHFLTAYAEANPDQLCIGIDISTERIDRANRKRDRARLPNLHFIQAEARLFLDALPMGITFSDIYVLFPDPWPKLRHRKHRLLQPAFLKVVAARSELSARLFFRTDFEPYFQAVADSLGEGAGWGRVEEPWPFAHETVFQSRASSYHSLCARPWPVAAANISGAHSGAGTAN